MLKGFNDLDERINKVYQSAMSSIYASRVQIDAAHSQLSSQNFRITEIEKWITEQGKPTAKPIAKPIAKPKAKTKSRSSPNALQASNR